MDDSRLIDALVAHEGYRQFAYTDSLGFITIGIGRCLDRRKGKGLSLSEALYLLQNDIDDCKNQLSKFTWYTNLNDVRKCAVIELTFNLGIHGLLEFNNMINGLEAGDYKNAATALLDSLWAKQVGTLRSSDIAYRIETGAYKS